MNDFMEKIKSAKDVSNHDDYMHRVKNVVKKQLYSLDPSIKLEDTGYFLNSFIPDFKASWDKGEKSRNIHIRNDLKDVLFLRDLDFIPSDSPAIISLDISHPSNEISTAFKKRIHKKPNSLITPANSLDVLTTISKSKSNINPLQQTINERLLREANGLVTKDVLTRIIDFPFNADSLNSSVNNYLSIVNEIFGDFTSRKLAIIFNILNISKIEENDFELINELKKIHFTPHEAEMIVHFLLSNSIDVGNEVWSTLGNSLSLQHFEKYGSKYKDLDVTPFVEANIENWDARRVSIGNSFLSARYSEDPLMKNYSWQFKHKVLTRVNGVFEFNSISWDANKIKRANNQSSETWENVHKYFKDYTVLEVNLSGLLRSFTINSNGQIDISSDVNLVTSSVDDRYFVDSISIEQSDRDGEFCTVQVDFRDMLIISQRPIPLSRLLGIIRS